MPRITRSVAVFGIVGTDPLNVGLVPGWSAFDVSKRDGINLPNPAAAMQYTKPHGVIKMYCAPWGIYQIRATQAVTPHRPGQFVMTNAQGCSLHATVDKITLTGDASEDGALGYFVVGAWGRQNGVSVASPVYGGSYDVCPIQTIDLASATAGWEGCTARNGTRVYSYWYGISVYHSVRSRAQHAQRQSPAARRNAFLQSCIPHTHRFRRH